MDRDGRIYGGVTGSNPEINTLLSWRHTNIFKKLQKSMEPCTTLKFKTPLKTCIGFVPIETEIR